MAADCRVSCNDWSLSHGKSINDTIITKRISTTETYQPSALDEIVDEERAILLETSILQPCSVHFEFPPTCSIDTLTIITDCQKLETFLGKCEEYHKTYYGDLVDEIEDSRIYRYDIELRESSVSELTSKFIPKDPTLWIYGIQIAIKPNLKALSTSMFGPSINFENVQNMLSHSKSNLTPGAEKCKEFLRTYMNSKSGPRSPNIEAIMSMMNGNLLGGASSGGIDSQNHESLPEAPKGEKLTDSDNGNAAKMQESIKNGVAMYQTITQYVDSKIDQMEQRIQVRLDELESRQNEKLNKIIDLLSKQSI